MFTYLSVCVYVWINICVCVLIADPAKLGFYMGAGDLSSGLLASSCK